MWLLREDKAHAIAEARKAGLTPSEAQRAAFVQRMEAARDSGMPRPMTIAGDVAEIRIEGVLTKEPDFWMSFFGGGNTAYRDIIASLAMAEADPKIKRAVLYVDSPGGNVDGLFDTLAALESFSKPMTAFAAEACSAAYAIASMARTIQASNVGACFGSIGVAATFLVFDDLVTITSTEAPEKRPDVTTEEGKASVRRYLDAIHELFVDAIARGRKTTVADVNANFGRGAVVLAGEAKRRGMVDTLAKPKLRVAAQNDGDVVAEKPQPMSSATKHTRVSMTEEELKAQFPGLYETVFQKGAQTGVQKERDRVGAHVVLGRQSEDHDTMFGAIADGSEMTNTLMAKYMAAGMNRADQRTRQRESDEAVGATNNVDTSTAAPDLQDQVAARIQVKRGIQPSKGAVSAH